jgi:hypothetical protein
MSQPENSQQAPSTSSRSTFMTETKANLERTKWRNQPASSRVFTILTAGGFLVFVPLFFKYSRTYLMVAALWVWIAFFYGGLLMILGAKSALLNLFFHESRFTDFLPFHTPEIMLIVLRAMGVVILAFMSFMTFEIFRNGIAYAFEHFGR